jgi:hypothetical protein
MWAAAASLVIPALVAGINGGTGVAPFKAARLVPNRTASEPSAARAEVQAIALAPKPLALSPRLIMQRRPLNQDS